MSFTGYSADRTTRNCHEGALAIHGVNFHYWVRQYTRKTSTGLDGGRIKSLLIRYGDEDVCRYDRGWQIEPENDVTRLALDILCHEYNA